MTIQEIIAYVDTMKPSAFTPEQKIIWLNEVEGMAQLDVMQLAQSDVIQYLYPDDKDHEPLVPPPHQKIYYTYMLAMIDFANGEYDQYQNTMALFNSFFTSYTRWFANTYRPANRNCLLQGYYLSAYSIAVKHGYSGSEEEWLATLKGEEGDRGIGISSVTKTATEGLIDFYTITFDDGNTAEFSIHNGATGAKGDKGDIGATGATGAKGDTGATGNGVASFLKTAGTGEPGSTDTYTMTFTDGSVAVVTVYNGADGVTVDNVLSATSINPVQNKVVKGTLDVKADLVDGVIPSSQLPSYVDDVIEAATISTLPATGEAGKIYVTTNDNKTWRWSGSAYVEISASLALGETAATAYRGDRGAVAYAHSQSTGNPHGTTKSDIGLGNADNTSDLNKPVSTAVQTALNGKQSSLGNPSYTNSFLGCNPGSSPEWVRPIDLVATIKSSLVNTIYPVGSIYMSVSSTSPATLFGGTWTQIKGRFLLGTGINDANTTSYFGNLAAGAINSPASELGGEVWHPLTASELPKIEGTIPHTAYGEYKVSGAFSYTSGSVTNYEGQQSTVQTNKIYKISFGADGAHNNMPPYLAVYMWKRTA